MNVTLIIGWKPSESGPQPFGLYCGLSGVNAVAAAAAAAKTGEYVKIGRINNPMVVPMPLVDSPMIVSGTPKPKAKPAPVAPLKAEGEVGPGLEVKLEDARQKRLKPAHPSVKASSIA